MAQDIYQMVTDRIIKNMEQGIIPWRKPWSTNGNNLAVSRSTGKPYSFLNQMSLGLAGEWMTFKQVQEAGGKVKKGEKASPVVFWKFLDVKEKDDKGDEVTKHIPFLRYYQVFHISQTEGVEPKYPVEEVKVNQTEALEAGEAIIKRYIESTDAPTFAELESDSAYYSPIADKVVVPLKSQFEAAEEFYSTAFHELTHSTMKASRCNREQERKGKNVAFGSTEYSKEELVAEMGSAFLMNVAGIEIPETFKNSTAYLQNWLSVLRNDNKFIVSAAGKAEKAAKYILGEE